MNATERQRVLEAILRAEEVLGWFLGDSSREVNKCLKEAILKLKESIQILSQAEGEE